MYRMRYPQTIQLELFRPRLREPTWAQIPPEVQQKTVFLLARLLSEHRKPRSVGEGREAPRE